MILPLVLLVVLALAGCARGPGAMDGGTDRTLAAATGYIKATR